MSSERLAEQRGSHGLAERRQLLCPLERPLAGLGVPLAQKRDDDLLNQAHFPVHRVPVETQMARLDPEGSEGSGRFARVKASSS